MIRQEAALPISCYIVPEVNTRRVLYPQPVCYAVTQAGSAYGAAVYVTTELLICTFLNLCRRALCYTRCYVRIAMWLDWRCWTMYVAKVIAEGH
jgi:hypothetical protein